MLCGLQVPFSGSTVEPFPRRQVLVSALEHLAHMAQAIDFEVYNRSVRASQRAGDLIAGTGPRSDGDGESGTGNVVRRVDGVSYGSVGSRVGWYIHALRI